LNRYDIINLLIRKNNYKSYLEIGVEGGINFDAIQCPVKHGVDPFSDKATFKIPSDEFFGMIHDFVEYDLIFVDGLHVADQAFRDISSALAHLSENGTVVVHDCNPPTEWHQRSYEEFIKEPAAWNGDVWKAIVKVRGIYSYTEVKVVDTDWGCGILRATDEKQKTLDVKEEDMTYSNFEANRKEWLNLITPEEFLECCLK
jgi:hypothetical protein